MTTVEITQIPVNQIRPLIKRARERSAFERMKESIKEVGLLQPVQVRKLREQAGSLRYELVCGQGRLEAVRQLKWRTIPAIVLDVAEGEVIGRFLSENVLRKDLPWLDQAKLIKAEVESGTQPPSPGYGAPRENRKGILKYLADRFFITPAHAAKLVRILSQASPKIERELGRFTVAEAESLVSLPAKGQEIVIETMAETGKQAERSLEYVVKKAKQVAEETGELSKTALKQSLRRVKEELDKQRDVLKLKRLHHSLGPENLKLLLSNQEFRKAGKKEGINFEKFEEVI